MTARPCRSRSSATSRPSGLLWTPEEVDGDPEELAARYAEVIENPRWERLPAVQAGRDRVGHHCYGSDLEAVDLTLDDIEAALEGEDAPTAGPTTPSV